MSSCIPVAPSDIQKELDKLEEAHKENKQQRACLFNLIVYTFKNKNPKTFRNLVDQISTQFPCRILFIEEDSGSKIDLLNTAICVKQINADQEKRIICEEINIQISSSINDQAHPLILPYIIPDLPIYLIWADDPTKSHPVFPSFLDLSHRLIFESECTPNLQEFSGEIQSNILNQHWEVADLNWIRSESWRKVLKGIFNTPERIEELKATCEITLKFAGVNRDAFCQNHYEVHYLHGWLAAQLGWSPLSFTGELNRKKIVYQNKGHQVLVQVEEDPLHPETDQGSLTYIQVKTQNQKVFTAFLDTNDSLIKIEILDEKKPNDTYNTYLMHAKWEYSLSKEICFQETSKHYCNTLSVLSQIEGLV